MTPFGAAMLLRRLEQYPAVRLDALSGKSAIGAIVVLGADVCNWAPEYGGETVGTLTLERVRYGASLQRATGLPMLVTGGVFTVAPRPLAEYMREVAEGEFGAAVRWVEPNAVNTFENAQESAALLRTAGVCCTYLVTHAWHMRRAVACFKDSGVEVIPAPTRLTAKPTPLVRDLIPVAGCLRSSAWALHEMVGLVRYRWTHLHPSRS
jgi:uncharacterized SAM-binding protein YcdF (DUF218 family)